MMKKIVVIGLVFVVLPLLVFNLSYADNAEVLPKGVSRFSVNGQHYFPIEKRYDPDGNTEDIATDLNATLDSGIFSDLALVEIGFGMPTGSANIGRSVVSFKYDCTIIEFAYQGKQRILPRSSSFPGGISG